MNVFQWKLNVLLICPFQMILLNLSFMPLGSNPLGSSNCSTLLAGHTSGTSVKKYQKGDTHKQVFKQAITLCPD